MTDATPTNPITVPSITMVLLDRDGVINFDSPDYIKTPEEWHPIPGALEAIAHLQQHWPVAVCTNQAGVGRGLFSIDALYAIHCRFNEALQSVGGAPVPIYFCPHHPDANCECRKPNPGLLNQAISAHSQQAIGVMYVGDSEKDLLAAERANCIPVLVKTGNGTTTASTEIGQQCQHVYADLGEFARTLTRTLTGTLTRPD